MQARTLAVGPVDAATLDLVPYAVAVLDDIGRIVLVNRAWAALSEGPDHMWRGAVGDLLVAHLRTAPSSEAAALDHVGDGLQRVLAGRTPSFEIHYERPGPESRWFLVSIASLPTAGAIVTVIDTTAHHTVEAVLADLAFRDPLTGLANRHLLGDRLRHTLRRIRRTGEIAAVALIDLDRFKEVNDHYGHDAGDRVLIEAAVRLTSITRDSDTCARWGGDEFVLVADPIEPEGLPGLIERIHAAFRPEFPVHPVPLTVSASVGAVLTAPGLSEMTLLKQADQQMYQAKSRR